MLVVDDHADTSAMYALDLTRRGFRVMTAASAEEATALLTSELGVVVLDSRLPGESGAALALRLRRDARTCDAAILMLSGDTSARARALAAGCDAFLLKPCIPEQLAAEIAAVLARRRRSVAPPPATTTGPLPPRPPSGTSDT